MENYVNLLNTHNLKATPQRLALLEIVEGVGHINIDDLYLKVKKRFDSISLATIYKNIKSMQENMVLTEVKLPNTKSVYEIAKQDHGHFQCKKCYSIVDIQIPNNNIEVEISKKYGFNIDTTDIILNGVCDKCK